MIRSLSFAFAILASPVAADEWFVSLLVNQGPSYELSGTLNSIMSANGTRDYMSSEAFAEGIDSGSVDCESADYFEMDYFFGQDGAFGGHILFGLDTSGPVAQAVEPALFYDEMDRRDDIIRSYVGLDGVSVRIDSFECIANKPIVEITYKSAVFLEFGEGPQQLFVTGQAGADMILRDMNDY